MSELFYGQRWTFSSLSALWFCFNYSLFSRFRCTQCWPTWVGLLHSFIYILRYLGSGVPGNGLTLGYLSCNLPTLVSFSSQHTTFTHPLCRVKTLFQHSQLKIRIDIHQRQYHIVILFIECLIWFLVFCSQSPIYTSY